MGHIFSETDRQEDRQTGSHLVTERHVVMENKFGQVEEMFLGTKVNGGLN